MHGKRKIVGVDNVVDEGNAIITYVKNYVNNLCKELSLFGLLWQVHIDGQSFVD